MTQPRILPLYERHAALGARFGEFAGWQMPLWYGGALEEHLAVRNTAGVFDISHMGRFAVSGQDAAATLASVFSKDPEQIEMGRSVYALACNDSGGIIDDLLIYRLGEDEFFVICNAANAARIGAIMASAASPRLSIVDRQAETVLLAIQGPKAVETTSRIVATELSRVGRHACIELSVSGESYFCARGGYTGEDGFEVMTSPAAGDAMLRRLTEDEGVLPCGLAARDSLRLEAALPLHGSDIDETTSPWEAGLGWAIDLAHDFTGRNALVALKDAATNRLTCLVSDAPGVFRHGRSLYDGERELAMLTSGGFSPMLNRSIAMAYLPRALAREGTPLEIDLRGRRVACHSVKRPFYTSADLTRQRSE